MQHKFLLHMPMHTRMRAQARTYTCTHMHAHPRMHTHRHPHTKEHTCTWVHTNKICYQLPCSSPCLIVLSSPISTIHANATLLITELTKYVNLESAMVNQHQWSWFIYIWNMYENITALNLLLAQITLPNFHATIADQLYPNLGLLLKPKGRKECIFDLKKK